MAQWLPGEANSLPRLDVKLLGGFAVSAGGTTVETLKSARLQSLLAYLLVHRSAPQSRQQLAFLFWPDSSETQAQANLRTLIVALRRSLPASERYLSVSRATLQWRADQPFTFDVLAFERALGSAFPDPPVRPGPATGQAISSSSAGLASHEQIRALRRAVDLYTGDLLPGCYDEWIEGPRERLRQRFLDAMQHLVSQLEAEGDLGSAILYSRRLLRHDPLQEEHYRRLMHLYMAAGEPASALGLYRQCEAFLKREIGVEPGRSTRDLRDKAQQMLRQGAVGQGDGGWVSSAGGMGLQEARAGRVSAGSGGTRGRTGNPPTPSSAFVGRERQVTALIELIGLPRVRLVTLTGPPGVGKTRLALHAASSFTPSGPVTPPLPTPFPDGVYLVSLAPIAEARLVEPAIAQTLGVQYSDSRTIRDALCERIGDSRLLLLLDNFEHLISAAPVVSDLLSACPGLKVLATTRSVLNLAGEHEFAVPPMSVPARDVPGQPDELAQYEAVALFVERAAEVAPGFVLTRHNAHAVGEICRRLEGLPLAIELAAARVRVLPPESILSRLDRRLRLLVGGRLDLPGRQRTLEAAITWSYNLLDAEDKATFRGISVFSGGCTLEAAEHVLRKAGNDGSDVLEGVSSLLSKSLLVRIDGAQPRFTMLETLREYALNKLRENREEDALRREHALYFMALAEEAEPHLQGPEQGEWFNRLEIENDNFRAALRWALDAYNSKEAGAQEALEVALRMVGALWRVWLFRGHMSDSREEFTQILAAFREQGQLDGEPDDRPQLYIYLAKALFGAGSLAIQQDDYPAARAFHERCLRIRQEIGDKEGAVQALQSLGFLAQVICDFGLALSYYEQALQMAQEIGDARSINYSLSYLGDMARILGDHDAARSLYKQSIDLGQKRGDKWAVAHASQKLGAVAHVQADYALARQLYEQALSLAREVGHLPGVAELLWHIGSVAVAEGDFAGARSLYRQSLAMRLDVGDRVGVATCLTGFGALALAEAMGMPANQQQQHAQKGAGLLGAGLALAEAIGIRYVSLYQSVHERGVEIGCRLLGEAEFAKAEARGRTMAPEEALLLVEALNS